MRLILLWALPLVAAALTYVLPGHRAALRGGALMTVAGGHFVVVVSLWARPAVAAFGGCLEADALGLMVLTLTSVLFLGAAVYSTGFLQRERPRSGRVFATGLLAFLGAASMVALSQHLALLWVGMEAA